MYTIVCMIGALICEWKMENENVRLLFAFVSARIVTFLNPLLGDRGKGGIINIYKGKQKLL